MSENGRARTVKPSFENQGVTIPVSAILPLKLVSTEIKKTPNYARIVASIREVGLVEALVVTRKAQDDGKYLLLDGHLRLEALKGMGATEVSCLLSTDDEAFTYNRRINRLAIIQEHKMILKALERGVPEDRIARALNIEIGTLRSRKTLLSGICSEAIDILKDKDVAISTFAILRKMTAIRQIEAAELMTAMNQFSSTYAKSLLAATPRNQLVGSERKIVKGLTSDQVGLIEREAANLDREFKFAAQSYGTDHLDLVLARGYLGKLLANARVVRFFAQNYSEFLGEFQSILDAHGTSRNDTGSRGVRIRDRDQARM